MVIYKNKCMIMKDMMMNFYGVIVSERVKYKRI